MSFTSCDIGLWILNLWKKPSPKDSHRPKRGVRWGAEYLYVETRVTNDSNAFYSLLRLGIENRPQEATIWRWKISSSHFGEVCQQTLGNHALSGISERSLRTNIEDLKFSITFEVVDNQLARDNPSKCNWQVQNKWMLPIDFISDKRTVVTRLLIPVLDALCWIWLCVPFHLPVRNESSFQKQLSQNALGRKSKCLRQKQKCVPLEDLSFCQERVYIILNSAKPLCLRSSKYASPFFSDWRC